MLAFIKTAALVVILFLILALLSRMSAPEVSLELGVQHGVKKLVQKSQDAALRLQVPSHPVHNLVNATQALYYLDSALTLTSAQHCETITGCKVNDLYNNLVQKQEAAAAALYIQPVQINHRVQ